MLQILKKPSTKFYTSILLLLVLTLSPILYNYINSKNNIATRNINADAIEMTIGQKIDNIENQFDSSTKKVEGNVVSFSGSILMDINELNPIEYLSDTTATNIIKTHSTQYNVETNEFLVTTTYKDLNGNILRSVSEYAEPVLDEEADDVYLTIQGETISVKETLMSDSVEECFVATATASAALLYLGISALALAGIFALNAIASSETTYIQQTRIETAIQTTVSKIWAWFTKIVKTIVTVITTIFIAKTLPKIQIGDTVYKMVEVAVAGITAALTALAAESYYGILAEPTTGQIYLTTGPITVEHAIRIMNTPFVFDSLTTEGKQMVASVYTFLAQKAYAVTAVVGMSPRTPNFYAPENHNYAKGYLYHYHSISEVTMANGMAHAPHAFFGLPYVPFVG